MISEYQQRERDHDRSGRQHHFAFAEKPLGDYRGERCGTRGNQRIAEQNHAEQLVGPGEESERKLGSADAPLRAKPQPVTIDGHHRGLGDGKEARDEKQQDQPKQKRGNRNFAQIRERARGGGLSIWPRRDTVKERLLPDAFSAGE